MITDRIRAARAARSDAEQARQRELEAQAAAETARKQREEAEKAIPRAERDAERAERELEQAQRGSVHVIEQHLARARSLASSDFARQPVDQAQRSLARSFLYASSTNAAQVLTALASTDPIAGAWHAAGDAARTLLNRVGDEGLMDSVYAQIDAQEIESWRGFVERIHQMAGER